MQQMCMYLAGTCDCFAACQGKSHRMHQQQHPGVHHLLEGCCSFSLVLLLAADCLFPQTGSINIIMLLINRLTLKNILSVHSMHVLH